MAARTTLELGELLNLAAYEGADLVAEGRNVEVSLVRLAAHDGSAVSWHATLIGPYAFGRSCSLPEDAVWDLVETIRSKVDAQRFHKAKEKTA